MSRTYRTSGSSTMETRKGHNNPSEAERMSAPIVSDLDYYRFPFWGTVVVALGFLISIILLVAYLS